jgi:hypothetical protein
MLEGFLWGSKKTKKNDVAEVQEKFYTLQAEFKALESREIKILVYI